MLIPIALPETEPTILIIAKGFVDRGAAAIIT